MKITITGRFTTGIDEYQEITSNEEEFIFTMNKIINNAVCNWPTLIKCEGRVPEYITSFFNKYDPYNEAQIKIR